MELPQAAFKARDSSASALSRYDEAAIGLVTKKANFNQIDTLFRNPNLETLGQERTD